MRNVTKRSQQILVFPWLKPVDINGCNADLSQLWCRTRIRYKPFNSMSSSNSFRSSFFKTTKIWYFWHFVQIWHAGVLKSFIKKLPPVGIELTTPTITGLEVWCSSSSPNVWSVRLLYCYALLNLEKLQVQKVKRCMKQSSISSSSHGWLALVVPVFHENCQYFKIFYKILQIQLNKNGKNLL